MNARTIEIQILESGLYIDKVNDIEYSQQLRLACGAVISVYDKGTVLVQGKLLPASKTELLALLRKILPSDTRWHVK